MRTLPGFGRAGDFGSLAPYQTPEYYWRTYARRKQDLSYYLEIAQGHEDVLEYGIGNGRIALPLARRGVNVTGIDLSRPMLLDLEARASREPRRVRDRIQARLGDMTKVRLGRRFSLVIAPFNAFLHLYRLKEVELFLARVSEHLATGAEFVFDVSVPQPEDLSRDPVRSYRAPSVRHPETGERLSYHERFQYEPDGQLLIVWSEFSDAKGRLVWRVPLTHRQYFPAELEALLWYNGFSEIQQVPDFGRTLAAGLDSLVFRCRVGSAKARLKGRRRPS